MGMLGEFDRDVFTSDFAIVLLVVFIFGVVIIMLNVRCILFWALGAVCISESTGRLSPPAGIHCSRQ